jgi:Na+-transporting NADH:ubiquinone oxidoreductase subunit F
VAVLLTSIVFLCAMAGGLALVLVLADMTLANYGECTITVNEEQDITVAGGGTLLASLTDNKIFIPSACGGRGTCAYCKVKVDRGGGPILPMEEPYLTPEEVRENVRLSCQVKVREDMEISIPEELFKVKEFRARVASLKDLTHDIKELRLELIEPDRISFKAGQYLQLQTTPYAKVKESVSRAYSMSSPPQQSDSVELVIRLVPDGICTTWVFEHLNEGDEVSFSGPYGDFYLRETDAEMIFVAGGSGFAPIKSILEGRPEEVDRRGARFFFGACTRKDLFYMDHMAEYAKDHPNFEFVPALSEPTDEDRWEGETGLITEVLDRRIDDPAGKEYYLCGSPGMINACIKVFESKRVPQDKIFFDSFA